MSWLDFVLAVPAVGVRLKPSLASSIEYPKIVAPLVDELAAETGDVNLNFGNPPGFTFRTPDGFSHTVAFDNLLVQFSYPVSEKRASGKMPVSEPPKQRLYTELLLEAKKRLSRIFKCFPSHHRFLLNRIGIIGHARMARESVPPGLSSFMKTLESPWGSPLMKNSCYFIARLRSEKTYSDQCHYVLNADTTAADHPDEIEFKLDWQRVFSPEENYTPSALEQELASCQDISQAYFERVGTGDFKLE